MMHGPINIRFTLVAVEDFLGISSVVIPEQNINKVEISGKHSHNKLPAFHRTRILITGLTKTRSLALPAMSQLNPIRVFFV